MLATATPALAQQTADRPQVTQLGPRQRLAEPDRRGAQRRTPDLATFSAGVVTQGTNAAEALGANSRQMAAVIAALRRAGIAERDIQTSAVSLQPR